MIIEVQGLSKRFGETEALRDVSCGFEGGATGLLGPNGAGKTTLLRVLLGLLPAEGDARVLDIDPMKSPRHARAHVGYMPESECMLSGFKGVELIAFLGRLSGMPRRAALKRAHEVLYFVGLDEQRYRDATEYSLGMQQRLKLAQALVHDPSILFLDEPTNGLDPAGRREMLGLVRELAREHGKHVILSSHLLPDVEAVCGRVVVLRRGAVVREGSLADLVRSDGGTFQVRFRGDRDAFVAALEKLGAEASGDGELLVRLPDGSDTALFFRAARDSGAQVRGLLPTRRRLEDVFLEAMEDGES